MNHRYLQEDPTPNVLPEHGGLYVHHVFPIAGSHVEEMAVREPACPGNGVTEVGQVNRWFFRKMQGKRCVLSLRPSAPVATALTTSPRLSHVHQACKSIHHGRTQFLNSYHTSFCT